MPLIKIRSSSIIDNVALGGRPTAAIQSQIATTQLVQQEISNLVNSAPEVLDTLNELALSLGQDNNNA